MISSEEIIMLTSIFHTQRKLKCNEYYSFYYILLSLTATHNHLEKDQQLKHSAQITHSEGLQKN